MLNSKIVLIINYISSMFKNKVFQNNFSVNDEFVDQVKLWVENNSLWM